ncbi:hypothetical protein SSAG_01452 [Streptomyces sp. Mg1]|nr:hypothetical protein SSAG_01452 [Streptomyces sp. Mg1]
MSPPSCRIRDPRHYRRRLGRAVREVLGRHPSGALSRPECRGATGNAGCRKVIVGATGRSGALPSAGGRTVSPSSAGPVRQNEPSAEVEVVTAARAGPSVGRRSGPGAARAG